MYYLYGIVEREPPDGLTGLRGEPVRTLGTGPLAVVSWLSPELAQALRDMSREQELVQLAVEHEQVVEALLAAGPVLPSRLGQAYATADAVQAMLQAQQGPLSAALAWVRDRDEWQVKAWLDQERLSELDLGPEVLALRCQLQGATSGAHYLLERRLEQLVQHLAPQAVTASIAGALERLVAYSAAVVHKDTAGALGCAVYLVDRGQALAFRAELAAAAVPSVCLMLSGPWPPYHFASLEEHRDT